MTKLALIPNMSNGPQAHTGQTDGVCVLCKKESLHSSRILNGLRGELLFDVCSGVEELLPVSAMQTAWKKHVGYASTLVTLLFHGIPMLAVPPAAPKCAPSRLRLLL